MIDKEIINQVRNSSPYPVAKMIESIILERDPRNRCKKIIDLYEFTFQLLFVYGIKIAEINEIRSEQLTPIKEKMQRPTMGIWKSSLSKLADILGEQKGIFLIHFNKNIRNTPYFDCFQQLSELLEKDLPTRPKLHHLLDLLVLLRNDRFAHGSISKNQASGILESLEFALYHWILDISLFKESELLYIDRVEWRDPRYSCYGINLNNGTLIEPYQVDLDLPVKHESVFLKMNDEFITLFPYIVFFDESKYFYIYNRSESAGISLRCPFHVDNKKDITIAESILSPNPESTKEYLNLYHKALQQTRNKLTEEWLTRSQELVWNQYLKIMEPPYYVVNVFGARGSGKTFLGWLMEKKEFGKFVDHLEFDWDKLKGTKRLILDQYDISRRSLRSLRTSLHNHGIQQAIVFSRERANDGIPCLELLVTQEDINIVKANLYRELEIVVPGEGHKDLADCYAHLEDINAK